MSNEVATLSAVDMAALQAKIGMVSQGTSNTSSQPNVLKQVHTPIEDEDENVVVRQGMFTMTNGQDTVYAKEVSVRIYAHRQYWSTWNPDLNRSNKTVMSMDLRGDLMDDQGGFNLGRPSGYIEDWDSLPADQKEIIRAVKRNKRFMGTATLHDPIDATGKPASVGVNFTDIPFYMDVRNKPSLQALDNAMKQIERKNLLLFMSEVKLTGQRTKNANGKGTYSTVTAELGKQYPLTEDDAKGVDQFTDWVATENERVISDHNAAKNMPPEQAAAVQGIVLENNAFTEVDE